MAAAGLGYRGIIGRFYARLATLEAGGWAPQLSIEVNSDQEQETYKWLGMTPAMREWVGGRLAKGFRENGITIVNKLYELTMEIGVDEIRRDKTGQMQARIDEMSGRVAEHWAKLFTTLIEGNGVCYDGQNFFDTDHSEGSSGTQVNACTSSHITALDITTATAPTDEEFSAALLKVVEYALQYKDDQGEPMNSDAKSFLVMVPWNMWAAATAAVQNRLIASGTGAKTNLAAELIGQGRLNVEVVSNPRLNSGSASAVWYCFRTDASMKPLIRQVELFETGMKDETFENNRYLVGVKALRNVGFGYWQYAQKLTFS